MYIKRTWTNKCCLKCNRSSIFSNEWEKWFECVLISTLHNAFWLNQTEFQVVTIIFRFYKYNRMVLYCIIKVMLIYILYYYMSYYKTFFKYFSVRYDMEKVNIIIKILINFNVTHSNSSIIVTVDHTLYCILHNFYASLVQ